MKTSLRNNYPNYFTYPALLIISVFFMMPVMLSLIFSFTDWNIDRLFSPRFTGVDNFTYLLSDEYFLLSLKNTFSFAIITTFFKCLFGLILALLLNKRTRMTDVFRTIYYMPAVLSMVVVGIMFSAVLRMDGILNNFLGFIGLSGMQVDLLGNSKTALFCTMAVEVWKWSGMAMAIFLAGLQTISNEYYEASDIDGASAAQKLRHITLPLLTPSFTIVIIMNLIGSLKVFEQVYILTRGGPAFSSQVLGTYIFESFALGMLGKSTAAGLIQLIIIALVSFALNHILRRREVKML